MFVCACSDLSADMNITCKFTSSKFQTLVATTSQNKGMVSCFVLGPFERGDSHLSTTHRPPTTPWNTHTHTEKRMGSLERKAEKRPKSPSVSSFPFQTYFTAFVFYLAHTKLRKRVLATCSINMPPSFLLFTPDFPKYKWYKPQWHSRFLKLQYIVRWWICYYAVTITVNCHLRVFISFHCFHQLS